MRSYVGSTALYPNILWDACETEYRLVHIAFRRQKLHKEVFFTPAFRPF